MIIYQAFTWIIAMIIVSAVLVAMFAPMETLVASGTNIPKRRPQIDPIPKPAKRPKKLMTVAEAMLEINVDLDTIKKYILDGKIRTFKDGETVLLHPSDVRKLKKKPSKASYPVVTTFDEEHRITNPVEFNT
tara:strand:+ start:32 stop:427 length:396 start_codon:yes stop_codon:yes gene_type:complete